VLVTSSLIRPKMRMMTMTLTNGYKVCYIPSRYTVFSTSVFSEVVRRAYEGRVEADSESVSEAEDVQMSDVDSSTSSDGTHGQFTRRMLTNGYGHDRYDAMHAKRKFFRSSLAWDPLQRDLRNKMAATMNGSGRIETLTNGWSN
jgi:hypothetical protein